MFLHRYFSGQSCVFYMPLTLLITPQNQLEARKGPIHHPLLGPALNLLTRMELFHFPYSLHLPFTPPPFSNQLPPPKKSTPLNSSATPRSLTGEAKPERGSLFPAQKTLWPFTCRFACLECGSQKTTTKISVIKYGVWIGI